MMTTLESQRPFGRRALLGTIASLALGTNTVAGDSQARATARPTGSSILVACFTRTGNTKVIAHQIRRAVKADLFEIEPAAAYPEDYEQTVAQAVRERDTGERPALKANVPDIRAYDVLFLGFPIWGETAPPVIRSFLSQHDLSGKQLVPFITHGGYGQGRSMAVVREHAPHASILAPFVMQADQERRTLTQVSRWLSGVNIRA